jgi:hypothetical protein
MHVTYTRHVLSTHGVHTAAAAKEMHMGSCWVLLHSTSDDAFDALLGERYSHFQICFLDNSTPHFCLSPATGVLFAVASRMASTMALIWVERHVAGARHARLSDLCIVIMIALL